MADHHQLKETSTMQRLPYSYSFSNYFSITLTSSLWISFSINTKLWRRIIDGILFSKIDFIWIWLWKKYWNVKQDRFKIMAKHSPWHTQKCRFDERYNAKSRILSPGFGDECNFVYPYYTSLIIIPSFTTHYLILICILFLIFKNKPSNCFILHFNFTAKLKKN